MKGQSCSSGDLPGSAFFASDSRDTVERSSCEWWDGRLHPDLNRLERTEGDVGNELGRSTGGEVEGCLVAIGSILSSQVGVEFLEELITSVFKSTLGLGQTSVN